MKPPRSRCALPSPFTCLAAPSAPRHEGGRGPPKVPPLKFSQRKLRKRLASIQRPARTWAADEPIPREVLEGAKRGLERTRKAEKRFEGLPLQELLPAAADSAFETEGGLRLIALALQSHPEIHDLVAQARQAALVARLLLQRVGATILVSSDPAENDIFERIRDGFNHEAEEEAYRALAASITRYVDVVTMHGNVPRTQQQEAEIFVQDCMDALDQLPEDASLEQLSDIAPRVLVRRVAGVELLDLISAIRPPPIASALLRLFRKNPGRVTRRDPWGYTFDTRVTDAALRALTSAPFNPRSRESMRRALVAACGAFGATPKEANNWFRP